MCVCPPCSPPCGCLVSLECLLCTYDCACMRIGGVGSVGGLMTAMCPLQRPLPSAGIMSATTVSMAMEGASEEVPATPLEVRLHEAFCPPSDPKLHLLVTSLSPPQHRIAQSHATFITPVALSACPPFGWWYLLLGLHRFATRPYLKHIRRRTHTHTHTHMVCPVPIRTTRGISVLSHTCNSSCVSIHSFRSIRFLTVRFHSFTTRTGQPASWPKTSTPMTICSSTPALRAATASASRSGYGGMFWDMKPFGCNAVP